MSGPTDIEYIHDPASDLYRRRRQRERCAVVLASAARTQLLTAALPIPCIRVSNAIELVAAAPEAVVAFVDCDRLDELDGLPPELPVVGLVDDHDALNSIVAKIDLVPAVSSFATDALLSHHGAAAYFGSLLECFESGVAHSMLPEAAVGRVALLASSNRRDSRLERIEAYFVSQGVGERTIRLINDVYEELVTNALYDAPYEARYFTSAVSRTEDVELPSDRACEISYGIDNGLALLRVRDSFGALRRSRLIDALQRCASSKATLDESRGGAGLGLWRIFQAASTLAITVVPGQLTDIIVGIPTKGRKASKLLSVSLFFPAAGEVSDVVFPVDQDFIDQSVSLVRVA